MKITTSMKRNATSEWGGKSSKNKSSNTDLIVNSIDFDKPEEPLTNKKKKKEKWSPEIGETIIHKYYGVYDMETLEPVEIQNMGGKGFECIFKGWTLVDSNNIYYFARYLETPVIEISGKDYYGSSSFIYHNNL